jgi:peptidoglycan/LPS O-acetylase OafA/YrhL
MSIRKFRPDIEVLRAIAVIAVIINHAKIALPSGFIGVDIFFVISGFLITKHLHDEIQKTGTVSLKSFYARRILRIFPASMLVLLATLLGSFLFLSPLQLINYCRDALFSSLSAVNYRFAMTGTDYFQSTTTPSPFQHFWSLAVEEQYYLIWPLVLIILAKLIIRKRTHSHDRIYDSHLSQSDYGLQIKLKNLLNSKSTIEYFGTFKFTVTLLLTLVIAISLYLSYKVTMESQPWAYFGLHTRAWQLAVGAILAFNLNLLSKIPKTIASVLSWVGFAGLVYGFVVINESTLYPGLWALIPTLSTGLIVLAGTNDTKFSFEKFFDSKVSRFVGKISYSLYLIHWPVFVFIFYQLGDNVKITDQLAAIWISFLIAILSWAVIENPIRFSKKFKSSFGSTYKIGVALVLIVASTSYAVELAKNNYTTNQKTVSASSFKSETEVFNNLGESLKIKELPDKLSKPLEQVAKETGSNCISIETIGSIFESPKCKLGVIESKQTIVLIGDSHANQWTNTIDSIAQKNNYKLIPYTKAGCSMTDIKHYNPLLKRDYTECYSFRNSVMSEIEKIKPDIVITTELVYKESTSEKYYEFIQKLQQSTKQVVRLKDTPRPTQNIPECLSKNSKEIQKCSFSIKNGNNNGGELTEVQSKIANELNAKTIDTTPWFCVDDQCPAISNGIVVYNDDSHISETYAQYLKDIIAQQLFKIGNDYAKVVQAGAKLSQLPSQLSVPIEEVSKDKFRNGACIAKPDESLPTTDSVCALGDTNSSKVVVLIGDSHAHQWTQAMSDVASKNNMKLLTYTKSGCPMSDITNTHPVQTRDYTECYSWRKKALQEIQQLKPEIIVTSGLNYATSSQATYAEYLATLQAISKKVIRLEDTPLPSQNIPECLVKNSQKIQLCSLNLSKNTLNYNQRLAEIKAAQLANISIIDPTEWFCNGQTCPAIIDNIVVYHDASHISNTYAKHLGELLEEKIFQTITK